MNGKRTLHVLGAALVLAAAAQCAQIDQLTFTTLPPVNQNGTYNGYIGGLISTDGGTTTVSFNNLICDDFSALTQVQSGPWDYFVTSFTGAGTDLSDTKFHNATLYEQAALLLGGDGTSALPGFMNIDQSDSSLVTSYQYALWELFTNPSVIAAEGSDPHWGTTDALLATVRADNLANFDFSGGQLTIYTPDRGTTQEFLSITAPVPDPAPTPETSTSILFGTILTAAGLWKRKQIAGRVEER